MKKDLENLSCLSKSYNFLIVEAGEETQVTLLFTALTVYIF